MRSLPALDRLVLLVAAGALAACVGPADQDLPQSGAKAQKADCRVIEVSDGDTVWLSCDGEAEFSGRLIGADAPEIDAAACPKERSAGLKARQALVELIGSGTLSLTRKGDQIADGRTLVQLDVDGRDVAAAMIESGQAVRFDGVTYPDWCARL